MRAPVTDQLDVFRLDGDAQLCEAGGLFPLPEPSGGGAPAPAPSNWHDLGGAVLEWPPDSPEWRYPVPCPRDWCGAGVGQPCRSSGGNLTFTHSPRDKAAEKAHGRRCWSPTLDELQAMQKAEKAAKKAPPATQEPLL